MATFIGWVLRGEQVHVRDAHEEIVSHLENGHIDLAKEKLTLLHDDIYGAQNKRHVITANSWAHRNPEKSLLVLDKLDI